MPTGHTAVHSTNGSQTYYLHSHSLSDDCWSRKQNYTAKRHAIPTDQTYWAFSGHRDKQVKHDKLQPNKMKRSANIQQAQVSLFGFSCKTLQHGCQQGAHKSRVTGAPRKHSKYINRIFNLGGQINLHSKHVCKEWQVPFLSCLSSCMHSSLGNR